MKKVIFSLLLLSSFFVSKAQEKMLAADQNPNYKISQDKYLAAQEKLSTNMNTTVQETYKAYDWTEAKQEKKQQRIARRQERRLARINNPSYNGYNGYNFNGYGFSNNYWDYLLWTTPSLFYHRRF